MSLFGDFDRWWDEVIEAGRPEFTLFDMTKSDIDKLAIKKFNSGNCFVIDRDGNYFNGFILSTNKVARTECRIDFHKSSNSGKHVPRPLFQIVKNDGSIASSNANNDKTRRIPFQDEKDGRDNFWKLIQFLAKFKDTVDLGDFDGKYQVYLDDEISEFMNNRENYIKLTKIADKLNTDVSGTLRPSLTLNILRDYRTKLEQFLENDSSETDIQNWLDEENGTLRQQRCMIFGLEFIDFKREGSASSKNFDVLTRVGSEYSKFVDHVLIELKSPSADIFKVEEKGTNNDPTYEYSIHPKLARAIPQILEYRTSLMNKKPGDPELEKIGIKDQRANIRKCIIIIGKTKDDSRWQINRSNLVSSLGSLLEIWTYTELLEKLNTTIRVLETNYSEGAKR